MLLLLLTTLLYANELIDVRYNIDKQATIEQAKQQWLDQFYKEYGNVMSLSEIDTYMTEIDKNGNNTLIVYFPADKIKDTVVIQTISCSADQIQELQHLVGDIPLRDEKSVAACTNTQKCYTVCCENEHLIWKNANSTKETLWDLTTFPYLPPVASEYIMHITCDQTAELLADLNINPNIKMIEILGSKLGVYTIALQMIGSPIDLLWHDIQKISTNEYVATWEA